MRGSKRLLIVVRRVLRGHAVAERLLAPPTSVMVPTSSPRNVTPGQGRSVHAQGRTFALWNLDGNFYCVDDECPHRGGPLGAGTLEHGEVFCPLHAWGFDVRTGACSTRPDRPVRTYPVRVVDGQVLICLEPHPRPAAS